MGLGISWAKNLTRCAEDMSKRDGLDNKVTWNNGISLTCPQVLRVAVEIKSCVSVVGWVQLQR